jgi:DNA-binding MarR family transcriptional regulator
LLNRVVTNIYDEALRPLGMKAGQLNALVALTRIGTTTAGDIARVLKIEKSTLSRNLERMRSRGWIDVAPGDDARSNQIEVTAAGAKMLEDALPLWRDAQRSARKLLGDEQERGLREAAARASRGLVSG